MGRYFAICKCPVSYHILTREFQCPLVGLAFKLLLWRLHNDDFHFHHSFYIYYLETCIKEQLHHLFIASFIYLYHYAHIHLVYFQVIIQYYHYSLVYKSSQLSPLRAPSRLAPDSLHHFWVYPKVFQAHYVILSASNPGIIFLSSPSSCIGKWYQEPKSWALCSLVQGAIASRTSQ